MSPVHQCGANYSVGEVICPGCSNPVDGEMTTPLLQPSTPENNQPPSWECPECDQINAGTVQDCVFCGSTQSVAPLAEGGQLGELLLLLPDGSTVPLQEGRPVVVGRESSDPRIAGPLDPFDAVSRVHVELELRDGGLRVTDLNSTNGTWVDGRRVDGVQVIAPRPRLALGLGRNLVVTIITNEGDS